MVPERPTTPQQSRLGSSSPSRSKRPLSSPISSAAKRANSEDLMDQGQQQLSDTEGSLGASRLKISSTPASPSSEGGDEEQPEDSDSNQLPSYDDATREFVGPPGDTQLDIIKELKQSQLEDGDGWYLVSRVWYRRWITACSGTAETKDDDASLSVDQVGPINNSSLVAQDGQLRKPLSEGVDLELLPASAYSLLKEWYGSMGPDFERFVVNGSVEFYPPTFQIFLLCPTDGGSSSPVSIPTLEHAPTISLASTSPFSSLLRFASESFHLGRPTRLWRLPSAADTVSASEGPALVLSDKLRETGVELLESIDEAATLDDALLTDPETRLAVEQQKPDGSWLVDAENILAVLSQQPQSQESSALLDTTASTTGATTTTTGEKKKSGGLFGNGWHTTLHKPKSNGNLAATAQAQQGTNANAKASGSGSSNGLIGQITGALTRSKTGQAKAGQRGLVGLSNLGNTCFMNSAIQCMSNTKELKDYFLSGAYKNELNPDNPLGMRGQVAEAFGQLIERMWHGTGSSVAPREFKQAVSRFAPQFSGYGQQDSQELLAFLLDGTHEDLNRILKKPGTSAPDWEGGGDKELVEMAKTCWEQYRSRNDSVIVDLFQGQYRSTVVCPDCDKVSITFDPFMYVTTNLPVTKKWNGTVYVIPREHSKKVVKLDLEVPKSGTVKTLKNCVGKILEMDPKSLVAAEEWHSKFWKEWPDDDSITEINTKNDRILLYETSGQISQPRFRKSKAAETPSDPNAPIILVVLHRKAASQKMLSKMTFGVAGGSDYQGSPFVLSLTPEEAQTEEGIKRALVKQYGRVTAQGEELLDYLENEFKPQTRPSTELPLAAETPSSTTAAESSALSTPTPAPAAADSPMDVDAQPPSLESSVSSLLPPPVPSITTPEEPTSTRAKNMFNVLVCKDRRNGTSLPLDQNAFSAEMEPLSDRATAAPAPLTARSTVDEDYDMFSSTSSLGTKEEEGEAVLVNKKEDTSAETTTAPTSATTTPRRPLVKTGDYLIVDWDPSAYDYFFSSTNSKWDECDPVVDPALSARRALGNQKQTITLDQCLTEFTKEERLGEEDMWYCSSCKDFKQATKKVEIWKAPDVLVFALKRFSSGRYTRDKIDDFVDFPLEGFDMEPFVEGDKVEKRLAEEMGEGAAPPTIGEPNDSSLYDLYAVSNHFGGLGGGHYTAFAKNPDNNKWYDFDDSRVSPLSDPTRAVSSAAYLLFYRRRTARPIGGKKSLEAVESAIQSRQVSAQPSLQPSPFGSTDNLALHRDDDLTSSSIMPGSFDSTGEDHYRGGGGGFSGIFAPRTLTSHNDDELDGDVASINSAEPGSPPSFRSSNDEPIAEWETSPPRSNRSRAVTPPQEPLEGQVRGLREGENLDDIE